MKKLLNYLPLAAVAVGLAALFGSFALGSIPLIGSLLVKLGASALAGAGAIAWAWTSYRPFDLGKLRIPAGIVGILLVASGFGFSLDSIGTQSFTGADAGDVSTKNCGDVTSVAEGVRVLNVEQQPIDSYSTSTFYFQNVESGVLSVGSANSNGSFVTTALNPCEKYDLTCITNRGAVSSCNKKSVETGKTPVQHEITASNLSRLDMRAKDIVSDSYDSLFANDITAGTNATTYTAVNHTNVFDDNAGTDIAVGADGRIEYELLFKATTTKTLATEPNNAWWLCVDEGADGEWTEPSVHIDGAAVTDAKGTMKASDLVGPLVQASDWCYKSTKPIDDIGTKVNFVMQADVGQNPDTTNDDVRVCVLAEGTFESSKGEKIETGIYTDGASPNLVVYDSTRNPCFDFNIQ